MRFEREKLEREDRERIGIYERVPYFSSTQASKREVR